MSGNIDVTALPTLAGTLALSIAIVGVARDSQGVPTESYGLLVSDLVELVDQGAIGPTPTISATIETLTFGSEATISVSGTALDPIINFGIPAGEPGEAGAVGPVGATGATGATGPVGPQGTIGPQGAVGPTGATGPTGEQGPIGPIGLTPTISVAATASSTLSVSLSGTALDPIITFGLIPGPQGEVGPAGPQGSIGLTGPVGPIGETGPTGPAGPQGTIGPQGETGATGATGATGPVGPQGTIGPQGDVGPQGATGATGATGPVGPIGPTPTISATATGLPAGDAPTVTITGTALDPIVGFGIPAGAQGEPGSSTSITDAPTTTSIALTAYIGVSNGELDEKITGTNWLDSVGTSVTSLAAAGTVLAGDDFLSIQGGTLVNQSAANLSAFVLANSVGQRRLNVPVVASVTLDGSVHNKADLVCSGTGITISTAASFSSISAGFECRIFNIGLAAVTLGPGFTTSSSLATIPPGQCAYVDAFTDSEGNNYYFAQISGSSIPAVGLSVGVNNSNVPVGQSIGVIGYVNPSGTAVQIGYSASNTTPPSVWSPATVSGYNFTGSISGLAAGTYYVWAQETDDTSVTAVSGAVVVATYTVAITSAPSSGTTAAPLSVAGTVAPSGSSVQIALSTSNTAVPSSGWVATTLSGTSWTGSISAPGTGTYYLWAQQVGQTTVTAVSGAIAISSPTNSVTITSPPANVTEGTAVSLTGTVYPNGTAVEVQFGTSASTPPTGTWTAATVSAGSWSANVTAPSTTGTYYIWAQQTGDTAVRTVSPAVSVNAPGNLVIETTYGSQTFTISSGFPISSVQTPGATIGANFIPSAVISGSTANFYFTEGTPPTTKPSSGGQAATLVSGSTWGGYIAAPSTAGTWYLSLWVDSSGASVAGCVLSAMTVS